MVAATVSLLCIAAFTCNLVWLAAANDVAGTYTIDVSDGLGRKFDGIGGLSGGGATSKLLVNYPEKQRNEILDYLFKPNFGASLQILKVEIGGDEQSTDGTEASHMHNSWDENYRRGYEWWLMVEAKKRNPNIKLYGLPWGFPGWVGNGVHNPYQTPAVTADYICRWINGAKQYYNLTIDFVGIWNERDYDTTYIKVLRKTLDSRGFKNTRIVAADGKWEIVDDIIKDPELAAAVDYIGVHYPGTISNASALTTGKQLWASEDFSTFNDEVGGGCWARILNQNYVVGQFTATISWNLIASYYEGLPWFRAGLMTAVEPWSGHYSVDSPIWLSAHITQFTEIGWTYIFNGSGNGLLMNGGSVVALTSPDGKDLTFVFETMSHNHSICVRPPLPKYDVRPQNLTLQLLGPFATHTYLNVWYSKLGFGAQETTLFKKEEPVKLINGTITISLGVDEVYTLTTLTRGQKGQYPDPPPSAPFPLPYTDDFESYALSEEPFNLAQQTGAYEIVASDADHGQAARQMVLQTPTYWCKNASDAINKSINMIGSSAWTDISVSVEALLGDANGTDGVFVAVRVQNGGCQSSNAKGLFFFLYPQNQQYMLSLDLAQKQLLTTGAVVTNPGQWNRLSLRVQGSVVEGMVNGILTFSRAVPEINAEGFVALGTNTYGIADFDNLNISTVHEGITMMEETPSSAKQRVENNLYFESENH